MIRAAGMGAVFHLLATPAEHRSPAFSHAMREAVLSAATVARTHREPPAADPVVPHAVALRSLVATDDLRDPPLTGNEAALLREWLARLAGSPGGSTRCR